MTSNYSSHRSCGISRVSPLSRHEGTGSTSGQPLLYVLQAIPAPASYPAITSQYRRALLMRSRMSLLTGSAAMAKDPRPRFHIARIPGDSSRQLGNSIWGTWVPWHMMDVVHNKPAYRGLVRLSKPLAGAVRPTTSLVPLAHPLRFTGHRGPRGYPALALDTGGVQGTVRG